MLSISKESLALECMRRFTTYPDYFYTWVNDDRVPDMAVVLLTLHEAARENLLRVIGTTGGD